MNFGWKVTDGQEEEVLSSIVVRVETESSCHVMHSCYRVKDVRLELDGVV